MILGAAGQISAQQHKFIKYIFPVVPEFKQSGFFVAPGFTYMAPGSNNEHKFRFQPEGEEYTFESRPKGSLRYMLQAGYYRTFQEERFFDFLEAGLSFKILKGTEEYGVIDHDYSVPPEEYSAFEDQFAGLFFRATKVMQLSDYTFFTASLGINGDYLVNENRDTNHIFAPDPEMPEEILAQAHLQVGFGIKVSDKILVIPTLETPILNLWPFDEGKSTLPYFNSRYRPILLTFKIMFLRPDPLNCNAPMFEGPQPSLE